MGPATEGTRRTRSHRFEARDLAEARAFRDAFAERFGTVAPRAVACLEEGVEDAMSVVALPGKSRKRLQTTNMMERLNEAIRRREWGRWIFPNAESAWRFIGAPLVEIHETWAWRCCLEMDEFHEWLAERRPARPPEDAVSLS